MANACETWTGSLASPDGVLVDRLPEMAVFAAPWLM
jgi:hypothetical protein